MHRVHFSMCAQITFGTCIHIVHLWILTLPPISSFIHQINLRSRSPCGPKLLRKLQWNLAEVSKRAFGAVRRGSEDDMDLIGSEVKRTISANHSLPWPLIVNACVYMYYQLTLYLVAILGNVTKQILPIKKNMIRKRSEYGRKEW